LHLKNVIFVLMVVGCIKEEIRNVLRFGLKL
jgi:hypothetical protein